MKPAYKYKYIYKSEEPEVASEPGLDMARRRSVALVGDTGKRANTRDNTRGGTEYKEQYRDLYYAGDESQGRG